MAPLIVVVLGFTALWLAGRLGVRSLASWQLCLRIALAAMFLLTASAHFGSRRPDLIAMVPPGFPAPGLLVTLTGIAELLGAVGLLWPRTAPFAAAALAVLMVALFPANVHAAQAGLTIGGRPVMALAPRFFTQLLFIAALLAAGGIRGLPRRFRSEPSAASSPIPTHHGRDHGTGTLDDAGRPWLRENVRQRRPERDS
jgi:uncharacterized membrane protein